MSSKANPALIGGFVLAGFGLAVAAVLLLTSSRFFAHNSEYILYFDASLTGLDPGAPVKFRGVTVGAVKEVLVHYNQASADSSLPVIVAINSALMKKRSDATFDLLDPARVQDHVKRGLRGKLQSQSFLTGLLFVELDFLPGAPLRMHQIRKEYDEIPTAPVDVQLFQVDFAETIGRLNRLLANVDQRLNEVQVQDLNRGLTNLLLSLNTLAASPDIPRALVSARQTLDELRQLSSTLKCRVEKLSAETDLTLERSRETLGELRGGVQDVRDMLAPDAPLRRDLVSSLNDLGAAARSISALADFLTRHPNALLSGRKERDEP